MASPKMKEMNFNIPKPQMIMVKEGNVNFDKHKKREHKRISRGKSYLDFTKTKGAFGNLPVKTIPFGYDGKFAKKEKK